MSRGQIVFTLTVVNAMGVSTRVSVTPEEYGAAMTKFERVGNDSDFERHVGTDVHGNEFWIDFGLKDALALYLEVRGQTVTAGELVDLTITHVNGGIVKIRIPKAIYGETQRSMRAYSRGSTWGVKRQDANGNPFRILVSSGIQSVSAVPVETRHEMTLGRE